MADQGGKEPAAPSAGADSATANTPKPTRKLVDMDEENIPHPSYELYRHTIMRGANLGSFLSLLLAPPYLIYKGVYVWRQPMEFLRRTGSITAKGTGVGMLFGLLMTIMKTRGNVDEQIYDRSYRLRYNKGQCRMDKFTYGGILLGGVGGVAAGLAGSPVVAGLNGASMGVGLAVFAHTLTKRGEKKADKEK